VPAGKPHYPLKPFLTSGADDTRQGIRLVTAPDLVPSRAEIRPEFIVQDSQIDDEQVEIRRGAGDPVGRQGCGSDHRDVDPAVGQEARDLVEEAQASRSSRQRDLRRPAWARRSSKTRARSGASPLVAQ